MKPTDSEKLECFNWLLENIEILSSEELVISVKNIDFVYDKITNEYYEIDSKEYKKHYHTIQKIKYHNKGILIDELNLSTRTTNALLRCGIRTIGELAERDIECIKRIRNIGEQSIKEIKKILYIKGYRDTYL